MNYSNSDALTRTTETHKQGLQYIVLQRVKLNTDRLAKRSLLVVAIKLISIPEGRLLLAQINTSERPTERWR